MPKTIQQLLELPNTHLIEITEPHFVKEQIVVQGDMILNGRFIGQTERRLRYKCWQKHWTILPNSDDGLGPLPAPEDFSTPIQED